MLLSNPLLKYAACLTFLACSPVSAADISVVGVFPGKAVLVVDNAAPKTYSVGATVGDGARLVAADAGGATFDFNGKRQTIALGQHHNGGSSSSGSGKPTVTLRSDNRGHFYTDGQINGVGARFMVDTGASMVALPASDAQRMGIDYRSGRVGYSDTANGLARRYYVKLNSVKIGDIELSNVEASVAESGLSIALLGMSFLNRTTMQRDGETMTLTKRY